MTYNTYIKISTIKKALSRHPHRDEIMDNLYSLMPFYGDTKSQFVDADAFIDVCSSESYAKSVRKTVNRIIRGV